MVFYVESNALEFVEKISATEEEIKNIATQYHNEIYEEVIFNWMICSPVFPGVYEYPNDFGKPHGLGGTLRASIMKYSVKDNNEDPRTIGGYYVESVFEITGIRNKQNWYDSYDYALNFAEDVDDGDIQYKGFIPLVKEIARYETSSFNNEIMSVIAKAFEG